MLRIILCWIMIAVFPLSLYASDPEAAMLYVKGKVWVNGKTTPDSSTVFSGDVLQTNCDSVANVNLTGTNLNLFYDSTAKFEPNLISLQYGVMNLATSRKVSVKAWDVVATPVSDAQTEFEVYNLGNTNDDVNIIARVGDLTVTVGAKKVTLHPGQQFNPNADTQRERKPCVAAAALPGSQGGILGSRAAMWVGIGAVTAVGVWLLPKGDDPVSPDHP